MSPFALVHDAPGPPEAHPAVTLPGLDPQHLAYLRERGITAPTIAANRLHSGRPQDLARLAGREVPDGHSALVFPYGVEDGFCRLRWFPPLKDGEGRDMKFSQPPNSPPHFYIPSGIRPRLADHRIPLWWAEGEVKALAAAQAGLTAVGIGGLWCWRSDGKPLAELDRIAHVEREEVLAPDSDVWVRPDLLHPVYAIGRELAHHGASVQVAILPPGDDGSKLGLDDFLVKHGADALAGVKRIPLKHPAFREAAKWWKGWVAGQASADGCGGTPGSLQGPATPTERGSPGADALSDTERAEAMDLLRDPRLLLRVERDLTTMGVVGEDRPKVIAYLIATGRKQPVGRGLAATFKAGSSAGKNHIVRTVADLMPPEEVEEFTHLSPKALYYMGEDGLCHKLVVCTEITGRADAEYAIRALISEPFITSAIPVKGEATGRFKTETFKVHGPIAYLDTTTSVRLNPENATRVFELYLDEEEEQTKAIVKHQAREAGPGRFAMEAKREWLRRVHRNAQGLLEANIDVVIPFAEKLTFPSKDRRARRDFPKLLSLVQVIAFLHQYQRQVKEQDGRRFIEATLEDYALAHNLAGQTFKETLDTLDRRDRRLLETIIENAKKEAGGAGLEAVRFDRADVSRWTGRHRNHLVAPLNRLEEAEYLIRVEGGIGTRIVYSVNLAAVEADEQAGFRGLTPPEDLE